VISLPIEVLPDSELALQLPLDECGSSLLLAPCLLCLRITAVCSLILTTVFEAVTDGTTEVTAGCVEALDTFKLLSDEE
jgi:hypothetical protein